MRNKVIVVCLLVSSLTVLAERTKLKPGYNAYEPKDDIDAGREAGKEIEGQIVLLQRPDANAYISALGQRLAAKAPNEYKFPFYFKIVDDKAINAFALPGGPVYVN